MAYIYTGPEVPCAFLIVRDGCSPHDEVNSTLVQLDWDCPGIASAMGLPPCHCGETDGTVDCPHSTTIDMIERARDYIWDHAGESFPGLDDYLPD